MKSSVVWDITPCSQLIINGRFGRTYFHLYACYLFHAGFLLGLCFDPEDWDDVLIFNRIHRVIAQKTEILFRFSWTMVFCFCSDRLHRNYINSFSQNKWLNSEAFWVVMACSLEKVERFGGTYRLYLQSRGVNQTKSRRQAEKLLSFFQTTRRYNTEDRTLRYHCCENRRSNKSLLSLSWLYSPLDLGHFFSFLIQHTFGRTPSMGNRPVSRPLP
jgi:hypothetical protein